MTERIHVRNAETRDAKEIVGMQRQLAKYCGYNLQLFGITPEKVAKTIAEPSWERYFVAEAESELAGMTYCSRSPMSWNGRRGVYIEDLFVKETHRHGRGVGTLLLARAGLLALEYAGEHTGNLSHPVEAFLRLDTGSHHNDATLGYYERQGFENHNVNLRLSGESLDQLVTRYLPQLG